VLQATTDCISAIDAPGSDAFYGIVLNGKCPHLDMITKADLPALATKHQLPLIMNYEQTDIFQSMILHLENFKQVHVKQLTPLYVKQAVSPKK
jgi:tRNA A37 threonylcarbamoyladenosine modification protein TsaB